MRKNNNRLSLRQKMYAALLAVIMVMAALIWTQAKQTDEPEQVAKTENIEPAPLVIENQSTEPIGVYYGTITISGSGVANESYEGLMFITMDGEYIRVTCTDAVRSRFGDVF